VKKPGGANPLIHVKLGGGRGPLPVVHHAPHHPASKATPPSANPLIHVKLGGGRGPLKPAPRKTPKPKKARKWSPDWDVACCTAQAVGTLAGWDWDDVLALYWRTASDPDSGASILDTLTEALPYGHYDGLPVQSYTITGGPFVSSERDSNPRFQSASTWLAPGVLPASNLILGVTMPEPHTIAVTPDGTWWSWGEPFNLSDWPELIVDEAWAVNL